MSLIFRCQPIKEQLQLRFRVGRNLTLWLNCKVLSDNAPSNLGKLLSLTWNFKAGPLRPINQYYFWLV